MVRQEGSQTLWCFFKKLNIITLWPSSSTLSIYPRELKAGTQRFVHPIPMSTAAFATIANLHVHQQMSWYTQFGSSHNGILFSIGPWSGRGEGAHLRLCFQDSNWVGNGSGLASPKVEAPLQVASASCPLSTQLPFWTWHPVFCGKLTFPHSQFMC